MGNFSFMKKQLNPFDINVWTLVSQRLQVLDSIIGDRAGPAFNLNPQCGKGTFVTKATLLWMVLKVRY